MCPILCGVAVVRWCLSHGSLIVHSPIALHADDQPRPALSGVLLTPSFGQGSTGEQPCRYRMAGKGGSATKRQESTHSESPASGMPVVGCGMALQLTTRSHATRTQSQYTRVTCVKCPDTSPHRRRYYVLSSITTCAISSRWCDGTPEGSDAAELLVYGMTHFVVRKCPARIYIYTIRMHHKQTQHAMRD